MKLVATKKLLFLLADEHDRTYYVDGGLVKKSGLPRWIKNNPNGWKDMTFQFATNQKYFSTIRSFSNAIKFVEDGMQIIADRCINGAGTEEIMYLIILRNDPSQGINYYRLEYKSRLDFSKFNGDPRTGIGMNTLQDDVFALVQANENTNYSIPCNSSNPLAIKVLYDGTLLQDKLNYQVINAEILEPTTAKPFFAIPIAFTNNEGDNVGIINNDQTYDNFADPVAYVSYISNANFALSSVDPLDPTLIGKISFAGLPIPFLGGGRMKFFLMKSTDTYPVPAEQMLYDQPFTVVAGDTNKVFSFNINAKVHLNTSEKLFLLGRFDAIKITPLATKISFLFASKQDPTVNYAMRPLDVLQSLVSQITQGKYTADSNFLRHNNRKVMLSGSSLRSFPDAQILTNFSDFFQAYTSPYCLSLTVRNGVLWIEPVEDNYNNSNELVNLGNISKPVLTVAEEFIYTGAKVGYQKQTYNKRNGRYEYNCTHNYKFPINTVLNQMNLVSPYRADSFGIEFIRTGYPDLTTTDDKGDADVFVTMISDVIGSADGEVSNAIAVTIETLILAAPIIKTPYSNTTVYSQNPTITGVAQPEKVISVYVDGELDGTTASDINSNWEYEIATPLRVLDLTFNGVHFIEANASVDPSNISDFSKAIALVVNTSLSSSFVITSPTSNDSLYNNLPKISGIAPGGAAVNLKIDGLSVAMLVTNSSSIWSYQLTAPLSNGAHVITATAPGLADTTPISITVNTDVSSPLITSLLYGDILFNNLPLIKGIARPGSTVSLYLDGGGGAIVGGVAGPVGTVVADANGNWSFQIVSVVDPSGLTLTYVPDGLHIFSTTPTPVNVVAAISGFRLMRGTNKGPAPDYDSIRLDDAYIPPGLDPATLPPTLGQFLHPETLYNIEETTPLQMLMAHAKVLSPFLFQQVGKTVFFNGADVNANLVRKKGDSILNEGANIPVAAFGPPLFLTWYLNFTTKVPDTFNQLMTNLETGGYITIEVKGLTIYLLPIGTMVMKPATDAPQSWKLLVSGKTPLATLLQLFSKGTSLNIGNNMIYISDKNPLHFVKYNYTPPAGYHFSDIYDDWQKNRFPRWVVQPDYAQPWMKVDHIPLQMITNGVAVLEIHMVSVTSGQLINTIPFVPVVGKVALPNLLQEVDIPLTGYPEDQYWYALVADGTIIGISEKIDLRTDWDDTLKVEYGGSKDQIDYYFSTGIAPMIRVQGEFGVWVPESEVDNYEDEAGDYEITRGLPLKVRNLQLGSERSLIADWMALKMNQITLLDNVLYEGTRYTRDNNSKFEEEDLGKGVPELLIKMEVTLAENRTGVTFETPGDGDLNAIMYTLDATAFGQNSGVINVTADE